ncbi:MAG: tRNA uridine-5-carboxymethylaminomethyl(34) synthesis enzyme MnmG, partial [Deltaproteobacteria bacterium]|nr:tRNA uridine-5-carboxymethylaminomethyl(34) synthesis enzyme MnmG [Deltaproteobacteria bacterium]
DFLKSSGSNPIDNGTYMDQLLKRTEIKYSAVEKLTQSPVALDPRVVRQVEIEIKYEGYFRRQLSEIEKFKNLEKMKIPDGFDFWAVHGLSNELKEKLTLVRPVSLGQTSRIDGITPAALSVLMIALKVNSECSSKARCFSKNSTIQV